MKILRINWERILLIIYSLYYVIRTTIYVSKYGFDFEVEMTKLFIFGILLFICYVLTKDLRKCLMKEVIK